MARRVLLGIGGDGVGGARALARVMRGGYAARRSESLRRVDGSDGAKWWSAGLKAHITAALQMTTLMGNDRAGVGHGARGWRAAGRSS